MNKLTHIIREQDYLGKPISLTYKGSDTFKTLRGGVISIAFNIGMLVYTILQF